MTVHLLTGLAALLLFAGTATGGQGSTISSAQAPPFIGTWVFDMTEPAVLVGTKETVRISEKNGVIGASVQVGKFPPNDVYRHPQGWRLAHTDDDHAGERPADLGGDLVEAGGTDDDAGSNDGTKSDHQARHRQEARIRENPWPGRVENCCKAMFSGDCPMSKNKPAASRIFHMGCLLAVSAAVVGLTAPLAAQRVTDRPLVPAAHGFWVVRQNTSEALTWTLGRAGATPVGFEGDRRAPGRAASVVRRIPMAGMTVGDVLQNLIENDPRYAWDEDLGVIVVRPIAAWSDERDPLNQTVENISWSESIPRPSLIC